MEVIGRGRDGILVGPGQGGRRRRLHQGAGRGWASFCKVRRGSVPDARGPVGACSVWWSNGMSGGGGLDSRRLVRAQSSRPPSRVGGFASRSRGRGGASRIAAERPATAHVTTNRTIRTQRCVLRPVVDAPGPGRPSGQGRFGGGDGFGGACQWRDPTRRVKRPRDPRRPGLEATARHVAAGHDARHETTPVQQRWCRGRLQACSHRRTAPSRLRVRSHGFARVRFRAFRA